MNKRINIFLISFVFLIFVECSIDSRKSISSLEIKYYKGHFESPISLVCSELLNEESFDIGIVDTVIFNQTVLNQVDSLLKILKLDSQIGSLDARVCCVINFNNGDETHLCLGERFGVKYQNKYYDDSQLLSYLIKSNSGYYQYFPIDLLNYFPELKDSVRKIRTIESMRRKLYIKNDTVDLGEIIEIKRF
ncbi:MULTISPECIES: hypothetical protein [unclassified Lentimicrobium]|uniref:hypothetical protein n=1 Tax=unclassified Lentimicrobium TaxID=2677434 RepID=UPI0015562055|nr:MULTISPECIES: hypothetical protein [unclassified Lentimicrobium]NPD48215.1 hypothetical protein [Lentimicrobium sp. S6]NPD87003.1 hypothetical protein [Lentimicrobium sp. L6]